MLTISKIKNAKAKDRPYKLGDAGGLYILVNKNSSKYWRMKYRFMGKEKLLALGVYPYVSLSEARRKSYEAKTCLAQGLDPSELKKNARRIISGGTNMGIELFASLCVEIPKSV